MTSAASTYLAFDYGTKRIGVAVGNTVSCTASALDTVMVRNGQPDWPHITRLIDEWQPNALIVGKPLTFDDTENEISPKALRFGNQLNGRYHLPVHHVDERLTSLSAMSEMREAGYNLARSRREVDSHAARKILLGFLDNLNSSEQR